MTAGRSAKPVLHEVRCVECGRAATGPAWGWEAHLSGGYENEPVEVVVFCPGCALHESDFSASRVRSLLSA
jgi:hypothetical protein